LRGLDQSAVMARLVRATPVTQNSLSKDFLSSIFLRSADFNWVARTPAGHDTEDYIRATMRPEGVGISPPMPA
jgi:hypothetical protein